MIPNIDQSNVHLLIPGKVSWMADMYVADHNVSVVDAIRTLYKSKVYTELEQEATKLWHYGPVALYEMTQD